VERSTLQGGADHRDVPTIIAGEDAQLSGST
jgi:hypothetical protein